MTCPKCNSIRIFIECNTSMALCTVCKHKFEFVLPENTIRESLMRIKEEAKSRVNLEYFRGMYNACELILSELEKRPPFLIKD